MSTLALEVENLSIQFFNEVIFENLSFQLPSGKFLAVVGPNGSGKSCLMKSILGLLPPSTGTIRIEGMPSTQIPFDWLGYVPQNKTLDRTFPCRSIDLVTTGLKRGWPWAISQKNKELAKSALERVGARHLASRPVGQLSGGELQRVYLARCLVRKPKMILLDEPATGVDVSLISDMYRLLADIQQELGSTIVMVTHDLAVASYHADFVLLMNRKAISFGSPQEVLTEEHLRQTFGHIGHTHHMRLGELPHA